MLDKVDNIVYNICSMRLSRQGDYAVRAILDLASKPHSQIKEIAERQKIPEAYLQKVIWLMSKEGLVKTLRGPKGGIVLARPPQKITLREVLEAAEGPIIFNRCYLWPEGCSCDKYCQVHAIWTNISKLLQEEMGKYNFAELACMEGEKKDK